MSVKDTQDQPVTWTTTIVAGVLAFLAANFAAGFALVPSVAFGVIVTALAITARVLIASNK